MSLEVFRCSGQRRGQRHLQTGWYLFPLSYDVVTRELSSPAPPPQVAEESVGKSPGTSFEGRVVRAMNFKLHVAGREAWEGA